MVGPNGITFELLVILDAPMDDILATLPYVLPMMLIAIILLFYQRHLPREDMQRNGIVLLSILFIVSSTLVVLYAGFGSRWWGPTDLPFGSWVAFTAGLQILTDIIFGSVLGAMVYILAVGAVFGFVIYYTISPPEPDVVALREDLRISKEESVGIREKLQNLEAENKQLNEFITEKEAALTALEGELETIKAEVGEREASIALMEEELSSKPVSAIPTDHSDLEKQLKAREQTIEALMTEITSLKESASSGPPGQVSNAQMQELELSLQESHARWEDLIRRADTAAEVSDSVVSDLVELISQVESSKKDDSAKQILIQIIETVGRSMTRISKEVADVRDDEPRIELIGAIIMVSEIVDAVKKVVRS
jgi:predicted RNase H-like nuclease (RuvC/YqgF family)